MYYDIEICKELYPTVFNPSFRLLNLYEDTTSRKKDLKVSLLLPSFILTCLEKEVFKKDSDVILTFGYSPIYGGGKSLYSDIVMAESFLEVGKQHRESLGAHVAGYNGFLNVGKNIEGDLGKELLSWKSVEDIPFFKINLSDVWAIYFNHPENNTDNIFPCFLTGIFKDNSSDKSAKLELTKKFLEEEWYVSLKSKTFDRSKVLAAKCSLLETIRELPFKARIDYLNLSKEEIKKVKEEREIGINIFSSLLEDKLQKSLEVYNSKSSLKQALSILQENMKKDDSYYSILRKGIIDAYLNLKNSYLEEVFNPNNLFNEESAFTETQFNYLMTKK